VTGDRLHLEDVRFYGHHGVSKAEQTVGVWFSVDAELAVDLTPAATSDDLAATIDYGLVARRIVEIGTHGRVNLIERLAGQIDLDATTHDVDALLARIDPNEWHAPARREVLVNYIGFPFWDVLTFSVTSWRDLGEFDVVDAHLLRELLLRELLRGPDLVVFGKPVIVDF